MDAARHPAQPAGGPCLLRRIEADLPNLSPQLRKVATHLVRGGGLPHRHRITDLATLSGTAPVTIVRLAKRYGFKGFSDLKFAFLEEVNGQAGVPDAVVLRPDVREAHVPGLALEGALRSITALRRLIDHPGFMQAARWLHEADVVWVSGVMPGDSAVADCVSHSLRQHGVSVRSGRLTHRAARAGAWSAKSVQLHVAVASPSQGASEWSDGAAVPTCRNILLTRASEPGIVCADRRITLGMDMDAAAQALPAVVGLLAAWDGALRSLRSDH